MLALYTLIYNRFVSSQMMPAVYDRTTVDIESADAIFRATGQVMKFDGFMRVYIEGQDEVSADDEEGTLPLLNEGETLTLLGLDPEQHFTQPPPRYTQATLIKVLEEQGIGRPSTYAAIMTSILRVEYVEEDESKRMRPTSLGRVVNDMLVKAFPDILESSFTAQFEEDLDKVEEGTENWVKTMKRFYGPFAKDLADAKKKMPEVKHKGLATDLKCELDGGDMVIKWGRNGEFLACSNYPKCTNTGEIARDDQGNVTMKPPSAPVPTRRSLRKMRQADGQAPLALRRIPRMLRLPGLRRNQAPAIRPGEDRSRMPRMQRGRNPRASQPPRQDFLRMRPLPKVQVRRMEQSRAAAMSVMRRELHGRERSRSAPASPGNAPTRNAATRLRLPSPRKPDSAPASTPPA